MVPSDMSIVLASGRSGGGWAAIGTRLPELDDRNSFSLRARNFLGFTTGAGGFFGGGWGLRPFHLRFDHKDNWRFQNYWDGTKQPQHIVGAQYGVKPGKIVKKFTNSLAWQEWP
jgi:hypothetical protein